MWGYVYSPPLFISNCVASKNMQKEGYNCEILSFRFSRDVKLVYRGQSLLWSYQWNSGYSSILLSFEVLYPSSSPIKTSHGLSTSFASASKLYGLEISEKRLRRTICSQRPRLAWKTHASKLPNRRLYNLHCTLLIVQYTKRLHNVHFTLCKWSYDLDCCLLDVHIVSGYLYLTCCFF